MSINRHDLSFDFASLYPDTITLGGMKNKIKSLERRVKIKRLLCEINIYTNETSEKS